MRFISAAFCKHVLAVIVLAEVHDLAMSDVAIGHRFT
jgi:hypothetical protein